MNLNVLKYQLIAIFAAVSTVPLIALGFIVYYKGSSIIRNNITEHFVYIIESNSLVVNRFINEREKDMEFLANMTHGHISDWGTVLNKVHKMQQTYGVYESILHFDKNGIILLRTDHKQPVISDTLLRKAISNSINNGREVLYAFDEDNKRNILVFSLYLPKDRSPERLGVASIIDFAQIIEQLRNVKIGKTGELHLSGGADDETTHAGNGLQRGHSNGNTMISFTKTINEHGWRLSVRQQHGEAFQAIRSLLYFTIIYEILIFLCMCAIGYFAANLVIRLLKKSYDHEKELEMMVAQQDKISSMGVITSGIAHELNNPLANALIYTEMLSESIREKYPDADIGTLSIVADEIKQCGAIVRNLMSYARGTALEIKSVDMNEIIRGLLGISDKYFRDNRIEVRQNLEEKMPKARCNESVIHQTILNMFTNAVEAMKDGGMLKITTRFSSLTDTVKIDILDSGCGIPKALQGRVFDPFYSTKSFGERKGLGLYISYVLVKKSGGDIRLISTCGEGDTVTRTGTMFTIELPADRSGK